MRVSFSFRNNHIVISVTVSSPGKLDSKCIALLSPIHQVAINHPVANFLLLRFWVFPTEVVKIYLEKLCSWQWEFSMQSSLLLTITITVFTETLFPHFVLKESSSFNLTKTTPTKISKLFFESWSYISTTASWKLSFETPLLSSFPACDFRIIIIKCCGIKQYTQTEKLQQIGQI